MQFFSENYSQTLLPSWLTLLENFRVMTVSVWQTMCSACVRSSQAADTSKVSLRGGILRHAVWITSHPYISGHGQKKYQGTQRAKRESYITATTHTQSARVGAFHPALSEPTGAM